MRILMLGNSLTFANGMPRMLEELTGAEVVYHTRGGARLSEQSIPKPSWAHERRQRSRRIVGTMPFYRR